MITASMTPSALSGFVMLLVLAAFFVFGVIRTLVKRHRLNKQIEAQWGEGMAQPPLLEAHVTVLKKQCEVRSEGVKIPRLVREFRICVQTDDGRHFTYNVDEELYHAIDEYAVGTLALVGDRVFGFCADA